jgi:RNA polymerase sigma factor (sigma-70 family)
MSTKITDLAINYKQTKNQKILEKLLFTLEPLIQKKASYIYNRKWYPLNYFYKCKYCQHCKNTNKKICKECNKCLCDKGYFNLKKNNLCEFDDVKNDLILKVLELIEQYDITKDFYSFFGGILFEWRPSFITQDFIKSISHAKIYEEIEGEEIESNLEDKKENIIHTNLTLDAIFKECKTEREKKVINLFLNDKRMTQEKAGKILGVSHQAISLILNKLQKRLKNCLQK